MDTKPTTLMPQSIKGTGVSLPILRHGDKTNEQYSSLYIVTEGWLQR